MENILDQAPSEEELNKLVGVMDTDQSGTIEWSEFLAAMTNWLTGDFKVTGKLLSIKSGSESTSSSVITGKRKRSNSIDDDRGDVHRNIKKYFTQFRNTATTTLVQNSLRNPANLKPKNQLYRQVSNGSFYTSDLTSPQQTAAAVYLKLQSDSLVTTRTILTNFSNLIKNPIHSFTFTSLANKDYTNTSSNNNTNTSLTNENVLFQSLNYVYTLLQILEVFNTPHERREIADFIIQIFDQIFQSQIIPKIINLIYLVFVDVFNCLFHNPNIFIHAQNSILNQNILQFLKIVEISIKILTVFSEGPRIASTPTSSILHPCHMFFKKTPYYGKCFKFYFSNSSNFSKRCEFKSL